MIKHTFTLTGVDGVLLCVELDSALVDPQHLPKWQAGQVYQSDQGKCIALCPIIRVIIIKKTSKLRHNDHISCYIVCGQASFKA